MSNLRTRPGLFAINQAAINRSARGVIKDFTTSQVSKNVFTGSFNFDTPGSGIKSTQELNVDFSKFENHTFFGSAKSKIDIVI